MRSRIPDQLRCSYVVILDDASGGEDDVMALAQYLSGFPRSRFELVVVDPSSGQGLERNRSILRWVSRHVAVPCSAPAIDDETVRAALSVSLCEKTIVAAADVRFTIRGVAQMCELLDLYEAVEPQHYYDPLPWWSGIEMSGVLMHRAFEAKVPMGATLGVRRSALAAARSARSADGKRAEAAPVTVEQLDRHQTAGVFVRRRPPDFDEWLGGRIEAAAADFEHPARTALFFGAAPLLLVLAILGGLQIAATFTGVVAIASIAIALRGGIAGRDAIPLRASFFAPLWLAERSISVYGAAARRWRRGKSASPDQRERVANRGSRVASGE